MSQELKLAIKEVESEVLKKLEAIKVRVLTKTSGDLAQDLQILTMASDELDDVLLNWDFPTIGAVPFAPGSRSLESEDSFDDEFDD
jgi:hypothetical protein